MKKYTLIIITLFAIQIFAQDITNKLGGTGAGDTYDVTDSGGNVLLRVQGDGEIENFGNTQFNEEVRTDYATDAHMLPIAYGMVISSGVVNIANSTDNWTVSHTSTGIYKVSITNYHGNSSPCVQVTPYSSSMRVAIISSYSGTNGYFYVKIYNSTGTLTNTSFFFQVFSP